MRSEQESAGLPATRTGNAKQAAARHTRQLIDRAGVWYPLLTERPLSLYAAAVLRIGYGLLYLGFLLREFPHRDEIWGPGSPWTPELAEELFHQTGWVSVLTLSDSDAYFETCYATAVLVSALFLLGWRTRAVSILFAAVVVSFHGRAIFMTDGGDNLILLMALYLTVTACGRRWSLDARRDRRRTDRDEATTQRQAPRARRLGHRFHEARNTATTILHNCGMLVITAQVCILYGSAGLYKVQGSFWGDGTALHYVLNLDLFRPWPALSLLVDQHRVLVTVTCYLTVLVQVAFPFVLFGRLKYPVLTLLLGMHLGIAVLMGLPLFSGAMIIADMAFLPDRFFRFLEQVGRRLIPHRAARANGPTPPKERAVVPPQHGPAGQEGQGPVNVRPTQADPKQHGGVSG